MRWFSDIQRYRDALSVVNQQWPGFITIHDATDYQPPAAVYLTEDTDTGFALLDHRDGRVEIAGLYNMSSDRGRGLAALWMAFLLGGNYLECFENVRGCADYREPGNADMFSLPVYYHVNLGAEPVDYWPWSDQYAPPGWRYERFGKPGVVALVVPSESRKNQVRWLKQHRTMRDVDAFCTTLEEIQAMKKRKQSPNPCRCRSYGINPEKFNQDFEDWQIAQNKAFWSTPKRIQQRAALRRRMAETIRRKGLRPVAVSV